MYQEYNNKNPDRSPLVWKDLRPREMYAFLGILLCAGANNSGGGGKNVRRCLVLTRKQLYART